jgi:AraC-like DNA-binding protein
MTARRPDIARRTLALRAVASDARVAAAIDYIEAHLDEPVTVRTLAGRVHLSSSAFSRAFRDATGRSPYQFVKQARLERARDLLTAHRLTVSAAARAVGYSSTSHFIQEFRRRFGVNPGRVAA